MMEVVLKILTNLVETNFFIKIMLRSYGLNTNKYRDLLEADSSFKYIDVKKFKTILFKSTWDET